MSLNLAHHLEMALSQAAAGMTGKTFAVTALDSVADLPALEEPIVWQQSLSAADGPSLWIVAGRDLWEALGRLTFEAAGLDEVTDDDCRSTWLELVNQTVAGVAAGIAADSGKDVAVLKGEELGAEPPELSWRGFSVIGDSDKIRFFQAAWAPALAGEGDARIEPERAMATRDSAASPTFDILLDVALPVSVSFGKTSLQVREVLKLNTGSIVELDRLVADPVEVIVNNRIIARGEVVVVDGNYGVRINQLASRDERLRSGMSGAARKTGMQP
jgi:flagellar motor switch protein FliN/FliY